MEKLESIADTEATSSTCYTPKTGFTRAPFDSETTSVMSSMQSIGDVPWYGKTYMILEKSTRRAVTITTQGLCLKEIEDGPDRNNRWLCVLKDNYTGFLNTHSRKYLGHDGKDKMLAAAQKLDEWEFYIPRLHPSGGFQLLSPWYLKYMMLVNATADGRVVRGHHGDTLWVFEEV